MTEQQRRQYEHGYWFEMGRQQARLAAKRHRRGRHTFWSLTLVWPLVTVLAVGWLGYTLLSPAAKEERVQSSIRSNLKQSTAVGAFYR